MTLDHYYIAGFVVLPLSLVAAALLLYVYIVSNDRLVGSSYLMWLAKLYDVSKRVSRL